MNDAIDRAEKLLAAASSRSWSVGRTLTTQQTRQWTTEQWKANERRERCRVFAYFTAADQGRSRQFVAEFREGVDALLGALAPDTLRVAIGLVEAHEAENAVGHHFARCSYERSSPDSCETADEDDGQELFCKDYRRLAEIAAMKRDTALAEFEKLFPKEGS